MKTLLYKIDTSSMYKWVAVIIGVILNVALAFITSLFGLPLFLDTIGTVTVACIGGVVPGIFTALLTNALCIPFNSVSMFFSIINIAMALLSSLYITKYANRGFLYKVYFVIASGIMAGGVSSFIQWHLFSEPQNVFVARSVDGLIGATGLPYLMTFELVNMLVNILDKGISIAAALNIVFFIPQEIKNKIKTAGWKQNPLSGEQMDEMRQWSRAAKNSMRKRLTLLLLCVSVLVIIIMTAIEMRLYYVSDIEEKGEIAASAARYAAAFMDADKIDAYIKNGENEPGYKETENLLYEIRRNAPGLAYIYVVKIEGDEMVFAIDIDTLTENAGMGTKTEVEGYEPGHRVKIANGYEKLIDEFNAGEIIPPTQVNNGWGWVVSSFCPILDKNGNCAGYVGADASMALVKEYILEFMWRILFIMAAILIAILAYGMWNTSTYLVYPISSLGLAVEQFIEAGDDQVKIDNAVRELRKINIKTGDEIEKLYKSVCNMALNQAEQIRSIRHFTENTTKMQDGLIVTMADLVEKRDVNSGSHIQKSSAYVKIIAEGLLKKGYYPSKVTPKFVSDVERSAPLHDIGKIYVPDTILDKTEPLTKEEVEIKRTHTIAGKKIMENAISTVAGENYLKEARNMAAYHHERWDGKGYPDGLHGEVIPLSARIMAVADQFDVLTSSTEKGKQYTFDEAISYLEEGAGILFDPKCVEVFVNSLPEVKVIYRKYNKTHG
ncbi:MAG: HD domain-containing protein [Pseudobutyrivibrio sp.]|nr:HD domain-containing protein [Pseudobutyrivibrio sp.]